MEVAKRAVSAVVRTEIENNWELWVAVRRACPIGKEHAYSEEQIRYHYIHERPRSFDQSK